MKSVKEAAIQFLSPVLGSAAVVAAAALGLETLATVVLVTVDVVLVVVARVSARALLWALWWALRQRD